MGLDSRGLANAIVSEIDARYKAYFFQEWDNFEDQSVFTDYSVIDDIRYQYGVRFDPATNVRKWINKTN